jgi:hypothetical protein
VQVYHDSLLVQSLGTRADAVLSHGEDSKESEDKDTRQEKSAAQQGLLNASESHKILRSESSGIF